MTAEFRKFQQLLHFPAEELRICAGLDVADPIRVLAVIDNGDFEDSCANYAFPENQAAEKLRFCEVVAKFGM